MGGSLQIIWGRPPCAKYLDDLLRLLMQKGGTLNTKAIFVIICGLLNK
jgi:hypothetical protein